MHASRLLVSALLLSVLFAEPFSAVASGTPPMGVYKGARGGSTAPSYSDYAGMHQFETWFGYQVPRAIDFMSNSSWSDFDGASAWAANLTSGWPSQRWRATLSVPMLPTDAVSTLAQGAAGDYNSHFTNLAQVLVNAGEGDAIIRLGWEMNGSWYAWRVLNATDAANYRNYWVQIVTAMRAVPGASFKFDFCPANGYNSYPSSESYPGDAYVDIIGLDVYNTSYATTDPAARWNEIVTQSYGMQFWADFANTHGKQLSYPEWATCIRTADAAGGGDDPLFIQNMFNWITSHNVAYHNYWDYQAPDLHGQLSNGQFPNSAAKFKELFGPLFAGQVAAPENLAATVGNARATLTWSAVTGASGYTIERSTTIGHTFTPIATSAVTTFTDTGLTNGTNYYYVVTAVKAGVESAASARVTVTPLDATIVDDADASGVTIAGAWTSSTSGDGYYGLDYRHDGNTGSTGGKSILFTPNLPQAGDYAVYARWTSGSNRASNTPISITSAAGTNDFTFNQQIHGGGWVPLGSFNFAAGSAGNVLISNSGTNGYVVADAFAFIAVSAPQPPAIPAGVTATTGTNQAMLSWPAVAGANGYDVKRSTASNGAYALVASDLTANTLTDSGLANGVNYYYTITAKNLVGKSADSTPVGVTPIGPPAAPGAVTASPADSQITLSWAASGGATGYNLKRSTTAGGPYTVIGAGIATTGFTDTGLTNQTTYYYVVSAANSYGESPDSAEISAAPRTQFIVDNADATGVTISGSWTVSTSATTFYGSNYFHDGNTGSVGGKSVRFAPTLPSASGVDVYLRWPAGSTRATNAPVDVNYAGGTTTVVVNQKNNDGVWVLLGHFNFAAGSTGNVTVRNDGANGFVVADAAKFVVTAAITAPTAPTGLTATAGSAQTFLSWVASSSATSYNVKRATELGGHYTTVATGVTATNFTDTGLTDGVTYFYVISAVNLGGESTNSSPAYATPSDAAAVIVNSVSSGKTYTVGPALVGKVYTIDRTFTITALSPALANSTMIRTAYDDKTLTTATHLTFRIGQPSTVYVAYDARVTTLPAFLDSSWTLTTETFSTTHTLASPFKVYSKNFPSGPVTLGANLQPPAAGSWGGSAAHYVVLVVPAPPTAGTVTLSNLSQEYDSTPKSATAMTTPADLHVALTYDGSSTPPINAGSYAVEATITAPNYTGHASGTLIIAPANAGVTLGGLNTLYDGTPKAATATTTPANLSVTFTYDGNTAAPADAGSYAVVGTVTDANYTGTATGTLVIAPAAAVINLGGLSATYDGAPKSATVTTTPLNLPVSVTYDGSLTAPTNAGSYSVVGAVNDPNYIGIGSGTLVIARAGATVAFANLRQTYNGTARTVTITTDPADLAVNVTYDDSTVAPIYPGPHAVVATVTDPNYTATFSDTLNITTTVLVRHAPVLNGMIDGSVQQLTPENISLNGSAAISGDLLAPGTPGVHLNGTPVYAGTVDATGNPAPSNYTITLNTGAVLRHTVRRIDSLTMPVVATPPGPAGTRDVVLNNPSQSAENFSTLRHLTLNTGAGTCIVPPGAYGNFTANGNSIIVLGIANATEPAVYDLQRLTLNEGCALQIAGPVILTLANGGALNGTMGASSHPEWLQLQIAAGGWTLNTTAALYGQVVAPNGSVVLNGNSHIVGSSTSDHLTVNGNALLEDATP
jgi:fibronectin type 3 domain-containing protein